MQLRNIHQHGRQANVSILMALMLVTILGCVAFAVDIGYIALSRTELQSAADSAALAGAAKLVDQNLLKLTNQATAIDTAMANARTEAKAYSVSNRAGGKLVGLLDNTSNSSTGDIVCGTLANPADRTTSLVATTPGVGPVPNAVQVRVRRDTTGNGSLSLFFARVLGVSSANLQAQSTAGYEGQVKGFKIQTPGYTTCKLLPFALDITVWNDVVAGIGNDDFSRTASTGAVSSGSDGIKECKLYPLSNGGGESGMTGTAALPPGNFGTVDIGATNNSTADLNRQILYGPNASDLAYFPNSTVQIDPSTGTLLLEGDTGVSAGCKDELETIIGQARIIPLYSAVSGNGNNARYTIVAFAGIVITEVQLTGSLSDKHITIQPCFCVDANAVGGGSSNSSYYIYKPLGLLR